MSRAPFLEGRREGTLGSTLTTSPPILVRHWYVQLRGPRRSRDRLLTLV